MMDITSEEQNKVKKKIRRTEDNLRNLWDNIKYNTLLIIGVPEEEE